ncbi:MAG: hypothetical protein HY308_11895 [Gammaproteobacteria bacterium]|nr:hypothetical protein [Gammaproteobacteria bacterium]
MAEQSGKRIKAVLILLASFVAQPCMAQQKVETVEKEEFGFVVNPDSSILYKDGLKLSISCAN